MTALLCLPGTVELGCSRTAPQCESLKIIILAKSKYNSIFRQLFKKKKTLCCHISSTVGAFDLIPKLGARPEYHLYSCSKYINILCILCDSHRHYLHMENTQSFLGNSSGPQSNAIKYKFMIWIWLLFGLHMAVFTHCGE